MRGWAAKPAARGGARQTRLSGRPALMVTGRVLPAAAARRRGPPLARRGEGLFTVLFGGTAF